MSLRCSGITQSNKRCTREVKGTTAIRYCYQHKSQATEKPLAPLTKLPKGVEVTRKVETQLRKPPTKSDQAGWIYVYTLNVDDRETQTYYKIGRTKHSDVQTRIKQWKGARLKQAFKVKWNKQAERVVHLLLDEFRVYRYPYEHGEQKTTRYHTVRKKDGSVVHDSQTHELPWTPPALGKQIEWFNCSFRICKATITAVQNYLEKEK